MGSPSQVLSDYATLLVQGKAIINKLSVNYVLIICSQVYNIIISCFILLIPQVSIAHEIHHISVTSILLNISQFNTDAYYVLTAPNNTDPSDEISITVSGYNGKGMEKYLLYHHYTFLKVTTM